MAGIASTPISGSQTGAGGEGVAPGGAKTTATDILDQHGLLNTLADLRSRKIRTTFSHYISDLPTEVIPIRPRCPAGSLMEIALQPVNEDERVLEPFDERVLRNALTLQEGGAPLQMPKWLDEEQPLGDDERKRKKEKRKKKKKKRSSKRKRDGDGEKGTDEQDDGLDDEERRLRRKRKKRKSGEDPSSSRATTPVR